MTTDPVTIAQISDPHVVGPDGGPGFVVDHNERFREAIARVNASRLGIDAVVLTGDLTLDGNPAEHATLAELVADIEPPLFAIGGNHDDAELMRSVAHIPGWPHTHLSWSATLGPVAFVALDTQVAGRVDGAVDDERLAWLDGALGAAADAGTVVLLMHHPPFTVGFGGFDRWRFQNADALAEVIAKHRVDRIWCGHFHRHMATEFAGVLCIAAPPTVHQFRLDQRGMVDHGAWFLIHRFTADPEPRWLTIAERVPDA